MTTITADEVINALEKALKATWADLENCETITIDAQDLLEDYRRQSKRKYYLLQKHVLVYGVHGIETIVADEDECIISHIRQMVGDLPEDDGWWPRLKGCCLNELPATWIQLGNEKVLEEVIEWAEDLQ